MIIDDFKQAYLDEKKAREESERMLEAKSDELYQSLALFENQVQTLNKKNDEIEEANNQLKVTQAQLFQSEKLASLGQLSAGVAHEINNPLSFIKSNLETLGQYIYLFTTMLRKYKETVPLLPENIAQVLEKYRDTLDMDFVENDINIMLDESVVGVDRIVEIVQDLAIFTRQESSYQSITNINEGIQSAINMALKKYRDEIKIVVSLEPTPLINCYSNQMVQVWLNIIMNAVQSTFKLKGAGIVEVKARTIENCIQVSVTDNGIGIDDEAQKKLFDPFYTTKAIGDGTGLGLSVVYNILKQHNFKFNVESERNKGTTFNVYIPVKTKNE